MCNICFEFGAEPLFLEVKALVLYGPAFHLIAWIGKIPQVLLPQLSLQQQQHTGCPKVLLSTAEVFY